MNDRITLQRSSGRILTIRHSRAAAVVSLNMLSGFFVLLFLGIKDQPGTGWTLVVILIAMFLFVVQGSHLAIVCWGLAYSFDPDTRTIRKNKESIAGFDEVEGIQVRTIESDGASEYRLSIILRDDRKVCLAQTRNEECVMRIADEVADLLEVPIRKNS